MARNRFSKMTQIAVSAETAQSAINTEQTLDALMVVDFSGLPDFDADLKDNEDEMSGYEEADRLDDLGDLSSMSFQTNKMQAQHAGFGCAYTLGETTSTAASSTVTHKCTPMSGITPPLFTMGVRYGKDIMKARFADMAVNTLTLKAERNGFANISLDLMGSGKYTLDLTEETVAATATSTTLTLSAAVLDGSADSVHEVRALLSGSAWTETTCTAASGTIITVTAIDGAATGSVSWKVKYRISGSWTTFPSATTEQRLRMTDLSLTAGSTVTLGATSAVFSGGFSVNTNLTSIEWMYENNIERNQTAGSGGAYANDIERGQRRQQITLMRKFMDGKFKYRLHANETFSLRAFFQSESVFSGAHYYEVDIVWPKVQVISSKLGNDNGKLTETVTLKVLEDGTNPTVCAYIKNAVSSYAA